MCRVWFDKWMYTLQTRYTFVLQHYSFIKKINMSVWIGLILAQGGVCPLKDWFVFGSGFSEVALFGVLACSASYSTYGEEHQHPC